MKENSKNKKSFPVFSNIYHTTSHYDILLKKKSYLQSKKFIFFELFTKLLLILCYEQLQHMLAEVFRQSSTCIRNER